MRIHQLDFRQHAVVRDRAAQVERAAAVVGEHEGHEGLFNHEGHEDSSDERSFSNHAEMLLGTRVWGLEARAVNQTRENFNRTSSP